MARATGVQITGSAVRVVDLEGSGKKFKVRGYGESAIPAGEGEERSAEIGKAIREAFKAAKASREHVILGLATRDCILREITIPFTNEDQIAKVIKFEAEPHLQSCKIDDVVIAFHKVADLGNRSTVLVIAVKKDKIKECLRALESQGIDPLSVDVDAAGLFNLVRTYPETSSLQNVVVCEIGYSSTLITLVREGDLRIVRSVRMGTDSILSRVSKDLDIDRAEARTRTQEILSQDVDLDEDLFINRGDVEDLGPETSKSADHLERDIVRQRQTDFVQRLKVEITRSLNPAKLDVPVDAVFLAGPGANLPRLKGELAETMGLPVKRLESLDWLDHKFSSAEAEIYGPSIPIAAGLALKFIGEDQLEMDFRQEEFVFSKRFDRLKIPLMCLVFFLIVLNGLWFFMNMEREKADNAIAKQVAVEASNVFAEVFDAKKASPSDLERYPADYDAKRLASLYAGQSQYDDGVRRIQYMGEELSKLRNKLRIAYGLTEKRNSGSRSRGRLGGGATDKPLPDPSDYASALQTAEYVLKAIEDTGIRDFALTSFRATSTEVTFGIILPNISPMKSGPQGMPFLSVIAKIDENLKALPPEARFESFVDNGYEATRDVYPDGDAVQYNQIRVSFGKERL
ncbi:MAG: pilus assembly protein PilM [Planctomycetota bacterium]